MYLSQDIKPISYLKAKTADVINIVQSENDIENDNIIKQEEMFNNLEQKLFG